MLSIHVPLVRAPWFPMSHGVHTPLMSLITVHHPCVPRGVHPCAMAPCPMLSTSIALTSQAVAAHRLRASHGVQLCPFSPRPTVPQVPQCPCPTVPVFHGATVQVSHWWKSTHGIHPCPTSTSPWPRCHPPCVCHAVQPQRASQRCVLPHPNPAATHPVPTRGVSPHPSPAPPGSPFGSPFQDPKGSEGPRGIWGRATDEVGAAPGRRS